MPDKQDAVLAIDVTMQTVDGRLQETISGSDLHAGVGSKRPRHKWMPEVVNIAELIENKDHIVLAKSVQNPKGGRPQKEYYFTIEAAKHICLMSRGPRAKEYRQRLIDLEMRESRREQDNQERLRQVLSRQVQIDKSKEINGRLVAQGGKDLVKEYNAETTKKISDRRWYPHQYVNWAKSEGLPSSHRKSGIEVLRHHEKHSAAAITLHKDMVLEGVTIPKADQIAEKSKDVFRLMIEAGVTPGELNG